MSLFSLVVFMPDIDGRIPDNHNGDGVILWGNFPRPRYRNSYIGLVHGRVLAIIRKLSDKSCGFYKAGIQLPSEDLNVLLFPLVIVGSDQRVQMSAGNLFKFCCRSEYCTE